MIRRDSLKLSAALALAVAAIAPAERHDTKNRRMRTCWLRAPSHFSAPCIRERNASRLALAAMPGSARLLAGYRLDGT